MLEPLSGSWHSAFKQPPRSSSLSAAPEAALQFLPERQALPVQLLLCQARKEEQVFGGLERSKLAYLPFAFILLDKRHRQSNVFHTLDNTVLVLKYIRKTT